MVSDHNGIFVTKKQASVTAALLVILGLLLFIAGYFWGKQSVIDGFTQRTSQESFNDKVDYLLTMQSFAAKNGGIPVDEKENVEQLLSQLPDALEEVDAVKKNQEEQKVVPSTSSNAVQDSIKSEAPKGKYYATLAGFGKKSFAEQMVQRLKKRHVSVEIKTKTSKSASGKAHRVWYQVVTPTFQTKQEVEAIIENILLSEKIKRSDIKIV